MGSSLPQEGLPAEYIPIRYSLFSSLWSTQIAGPPESPLHPPSPSFPLAQNPAKE